MIVLAPRPVKPSLNRLYITIRIKKIYIVAVAAGLLHIYKNILINLCKKNPSNVVQHCSEIYVRLDSCGGACPCFADDGDSDLPRENLKLFFEIGTDFLSHDGGFSIGHLIRFDDDAQFAARL